MRRGLRRPGARLCSGLLGCYESSTDPPAPSFDLVAGDFIKLAEQLGAEGWLGDQVRQHELKEPQIPRHVDHGEH